MSRTTIFKEQKKTFTNYTFDIQKFFYDQKEDYFSCPM